MTQAIHTATDVEGLLRPLAGAYSPRTLRGYDSDLRVFATWCLARRYSWLPANPETIADGLRATIGVLNFEIIKDRVQDILTVSEDEIIAATLLTHDCAVVHPDFAQTAKTSAKQASGKPAAKKRAVMKKAADADEEGNG